MIKYFIPNKKPGEKIILFLRRHWIIVWSRMLFWLMVMLFPPIIYLLLQDSNSFLINNSFIHPLLILFLAVLYPTTWLLMLNNFVDYYLDVWIVTNERIIDSEQKQLFSRVIAEHKISKIQDVATEVHGILPTFLNYGDVFIQTAAETKRFIFKQVPNPLEVKRTITALCEQSLDETQHQGNEDNGPGKTEIGHLSQ